MTEISTRREMIVVVNTGPVTVTFYEGLDEFSVDDLEATFAILIGRLRRTARAAATAKRTGEADG